jgi:membrane protein DedA with SNARE-associated domain
VVIVRLPATLALLIAHEGYPLTIAAVLLSAAGLPLPVTALLVAVGAASVHLSGSALLLLCALCAVAAVLGDTLDYAVGRLGAPMLASHLARRRSLPGRIGSLGKGQLAAWNERLVAADEARGGRGTSLMLCASRFVPPLMPLATPISLLLGASRFALLSFLIWDALGEAIFVAGNVALGRLFSAQLVTSGPESFILWTTLMALAVAPGALALGAPRWRWRLRRRKDESPMALSMASSGGPRQMPPAGGLARSA